jgi:hypothetical protein
MDGERPDDDDLADLDPAEADAVRAARRRLANDTGGTIDTRPAEGNRTQVVAGDEHVEIVLPSVTPAQQDARRKLAVQIGLAADFGDDGVDAYVKGGPLWLYYGNRNYVLGLPAWAHELMVNDVMETSPQEATEMGRDLFMKRGPDGISFDEAARNA